MASIRRIGRVGSAILATLLTVACADDDGASGPAGSIELAVNPPTLTLPQGGSGSVTVALTRGGGFSGAVTVAAAGLPAGVVVTLTPGTLSGSAPSATADVTVATTVAPGNHNVAITASAAGVTQATTTFQLIVTPAPDYALSVAPTALTIPAGLSGGATVTITRTNFTGSVALALANPPAGITGTFTPASSTTNTSALTVSVAASTPPGDYPLTIRGTASVPGDRTATLVVTVTAPSGGQIVSFEYCDASSTPVFLAYQSGDGAWQQVIGSAAGSVTTFTFTLTETYGGVLAVFESEASIVSDALSVRGGTNTPQRPVPRSPLRRALSVRGNASSGRVMHRSSFVDAYETLLLYASSAELAQEGLDTCGQSGPTRTITATVGGIAPGQYGVISLGEQSYIFDGAASTNPITFTGVADGPVDLAGTRIATPGQAPDKLIVMRNLDIPDGGSLPAVLDFSGPAATVPATATATIAGGGGENLEIFVDLVTVNGQSYLWSDLAPSPASTRPWAGLNNATITTSDLHGVYAFAGVPDDGADDYRLIVKYVGPVADLTLALGPALNPPATSQVAGGAYPRFRFQGSLPAAYDRGASIDVYGDANYLGIVASAAWLAESGSDTGYDFTMPDVSGLAGFPVAARLSAGENLVVATGFGFTGTGFYEARPAVGAVFLAATRSTTIDVP